MELDDALNDALETFIVECRELLENMEAALLSFKQAPNPIEEINAIFRAAHTIKGSAGLFSLNHLVAFTHVVESVLDKVRNGKQAMTDPLVGLLLQCGDHLLALVESVAAGQRALSPTLQQQGAPILEQLATYLDAPKIATMPPAWGLFTGSGVDLESGDVKPLHTDAVGADHWHISVRFGADVLRNGMDPLSLIRYLGTMGRVTGISTLPNALPSADHFDPERCYLGFEIAFQSETDKAAIEKVFEFVRDDCQLLILPPHSLISDYVKLIEQQDVLSRLGDMLVACGTLTQQELDSALNAQADHPETPIGSILVQQGSVHPEVVDAALVKQKQVKDSGAVESRSIRVDAEKLDQLINLVGELIIAGANVNMVARRAQNAELQESTSKLAMLVEDVRDSTLQLRMVKIGATFTRFQRVVHDVSLDLGKDIALQIDGKDTELDKTVVEKIGDPLMHLVRNSMDHGIESAAVRLARGKPAQGTVKLDAFHDSGSVVITVEDDGGGLNRERILAKAIERGLVDKSAHTMDDSDVFDLIFEPGFSTAEKITNLSGRGVGLDVVKRNITDLRGTVSLRSEEGVGTKITVRLPLTLAIIDGFLVGVGKAVYAIPLDMIEECISFSAEPGHNYTNLRGQVLPFIRLRDLFSIAGSPARGENIVVLKYGGQRVGLVVDALLGEFQTVIKPLGTIFNQSKYISGSTILGSGDVALIVDVAKLVRQASQAAPLPARAPPMAAVMA